MFEENVQPGDLNINKMIVDIGAKDKKDAERKLRLGIISPLPGRVTRLPTNAMPPKLTTV